MAVHDVFSLDGAAPQLRQRRSDILVQLRDQTRLEHLGIEESLALMSESLTLSAYLVIVSRFYGFWLPLEQALQRTVGLPATGVAIEKRRRAWMLAEDLRFFEHAPEAAPVCPRLPSVATVPAALGCLYVLEGASLGGRLISRRLKETLGLTAERGCRFFEGYGDETGPRWRAFGVALTDYAVHPQQCREIVESAKATFVALNRWCVSTGEPSGRVDSRAGTRPSP